MLGGPARPGRYEWPQARNVDLRGDLDELDIENAHARTGPGRLGRPHHRRVVQQRVTRAGVLDRDQAEPDVSVAGARWHADHLRRRQAQHVRWARQKLITGRRLGLAAMGSGRALL